MDIKAAAHELHEQIYRVGGNIQAIGVAENTGIIWIYTIKKPTSKELALKEYQGFKVEWRKIGKVEIKRSSDGGI